MQVCSRGCSRWYIVCVLWHAWQYVRKLYNNHFSICFPFPDEIVLEWVQKSKYDCSLVPEDDRDIFGGTDFNSREPTSYWTLPNHFFTWWKNNIERKSKFSNLIKDSLAQFSTSKEMQRMRFCKQIVALAFNIRNHFDRIVNKQTKGSIYQILLPHSMPTHMLLNSTSILYHEFDLEDFLSIKLFERKKAQKHYSIPTPKSIRSRPLTSSKRLVSEVTNIQEHSSYKKKTKNQFRSSLDSFSSPAYRTRSSVTRLNELDPSIDLKQKNQAIKFSQLTLDASPPDPFLNQDMVLHTRPLVKHHHCISSPSGNHPLLSLSHPSVLDIPEIYLDTILLPSNSSESDSLSRNRPLDCYGFYLNMNDEEEHEDEDSSSLEEISNKEESEKLDSEYLQSTSFLFAPLLSNKSFESDILDTLLFSRHQEETFDDNDNDGTNADSFRISPRNFLHSNSLHSCEISHLSSQSYETEESKNNHPLLSSSPSEFNKMNYINDEVQGLLVSLFPIPSQDELAH